MRSMVYVMMIALQLGSLTSFASGVDACIRKLSTGQNRLNVKINAGALKRLAEADFERSQSSDSVKRAALLVDYSINSKDKRAFLIDFESCDLLKHEYVIHGGYTPGGQRDGDLDNDGLLDSCKNPRGHLKAGDGITPTTNMTRPGLYVTAGCHVTQQKGWPKITSECHGLKLRGLDATNKDAYDMKVVLHEHELVRNNNSVKPIGQGCPTFPPGKLKAMLRNEIGADALVFIYAPQCAK